MPDESRRPRWLRWTKLTLLACVLYVASYGPACWLGSRVPLIERAVITAYWPLGRVVWVCDPHGWLFHALIDYGRLAEGDSHTSDLVILNSQPPQPMMRPG